MEAPVERWMPDGWDATLEALGVLDARRVAVVDPPWFDAEMDRLGARHYEEAGFTVPDEADAVVVGGDGFRAVGAIAAAEERLDRPVLTADQVLMWAALRAAGAGTGAVTGYGRVFAAGA